MNEITKLKQSLCDYLSALPDLAGAGIYPAWHSAVREFPLRRPAIAVGVDGIEVAPGGLGSYWGEREGAPLVGSGALITLRLDLYAPEKAGGGRLHELYEALCAALPDGPFGLVRLWCEPPAWDHDTAAYHMAARAALRSALLRSGSSLRLDDFILKHKRMEGDRL